MPLSYTSTRSTAWRILLQLLEATYQEILPGQDLSHLTGMIDTFYDPRRTPFWVIEHEQNIVAGLWLGPAQDQMSGAKAAYIFMVYVKAQHRQQGLARHLLSVATVWAKSEGYLQLQLQVATESLAAQALYASLDFRTRAYFLSKSL